MPEKSAEVAPGHEIQSLLDDVYAKVLPLTTGEVATYIPELSKTNPDDFGVSLVTADGRMFEAGSCDRPFTIQSISKPFTFGIALEELGYDKVFQHVGVEPSGDAFNSIQLQSGTNRPFNPMINTGAITVTALLHTLHGDRTFDHILDRFSALAGRPLAIDVGPAEAGQHVRTEQTSRETCAGIHSYTASEGIRSWPYASAHSSSSRRPRSSSPQPFTAGGSSAATNIERRALPKPSSLPCWSVD